MSRQIGLENIPILKVYVTFASSQNIKIIWPKDLDAAIKSGEEETLVANLSGANKPGESDHWAAIYLIKGKPWKLVVKIQPTQEDLITMEVEVPDDITDIKKAYAK